MPFKAVAKFRVPGDISVDVFAHKKVLTISAVQHVKNTAAHPWASRAGSTPMADDEALKAAFVAVCEELEATGWTQYASATPWRDGIADTPAKRPTAKATEARLDEMSDRLAAALVAAKGQPAAEEAAIGAALRAFGDLNVLLDRNRLDNAIHFFAVDGVGLKKKRTPALLRADVDPATAARWLAMLKAAAR